MIIRTVVLFPRIALMEYLLIINKEQNVKQQLGISDEKIRRILYIEK